MVHSLHINRHDRKSSSAQTIHTLFIRVSSVIIRGNYSFKKFSVYCLAIAFSLLITGARNLSAQNSVTPFRVMTFNIRMNTPHDGKNAWPKREQRVATTIRYHKADLVGMQEVLLGQLQDLERMFADYEFFGVGRDDGKTAGEYCPIMFRTERFDLLKQNTFWLSETPDSVSRGWDAACHRIVTWGHFRDKKTSEEFYLFNTHFDHKGQIARRNGAALVVKKVKEIAKDSPFIVTGDFNATPGSEPMNVLLSEKNNPLLLDAKWLSWEPHHGPTYTYTGFDPTIHFSGEPIDYILVHPRISVQQHATIGDHYNGLLPSDHFPVIAEVVIR